MKNKKTYALITLMLLLPMIIGLIMWNQLPNMLPSHFNLHGEVDNYLKKPLMVFGLPIFVTVIVWIGIWGTSRDPQKENIKPSKFNLILWIVAIIYMVAHVLTYAVALEISVDVPLITIYLIAVMIILIGNMMPKFEQSHTVGIRTPWTLASKENWRKTHRLGGKVFVIGGFLAVILNSLNLPAVFVLIILIAIAVIPIVYSAIIGNVEEEHPELFTENEETDSNSESTEDNSSADSNESPSAENTDDTQDSPAEK